MSTKGQLIAAAVASMFAQGVALADDGKSTDKQVRCAGVNACKGQGQCNQADHGCAGVNTCKGKGWIKIAEKDCKAKKGTILPES